MDHGDGQAAAGSLAGRSLEEVAELARECRLCRLCDTRRNVAFGAGPIDARLMFVTEAPGYHEDRTGAPLAGPAVALLGGLLDEVGIDLADAYVTSTVKCRPPRNRSPFPDEIQQCEGYLFREVTEVKPMVVCALGNAPIRLLTGRPHRLSDVHGTPLPVTVHGREVIVLPLYHPAAVGQVPVLEAALRADIRQLPALLRAARPAPMAQVAATDTRSDERLAVPDAAPDTQLALDLH